MHEPRDVRVLARRPQRVVLLGRIVDAERGARLHGVRDEAVVDDVELRHVLRLGESRVGRRAVAELPVVDEVAFGASG